jgi:hypothetical protein
LLRLYMRLVMTERTPAITHQLRVTTISRVSVGFSGASGDDARGSITDGEVDRPIRYENRAQLNKLGLSLPQESRHLDDGGASLGAQMRQKIILRS